jgi:hypothetical protein
MFKDYRPNWCNANLAFAPNNKFKNNIMPKYRKDNNIKIKSKVTKTNKLIIWHALTSSTISNIEKQRK